MLLSTYYKRLKGLQLLIGSMNMMYLRIPKRSVIILYHKAFKEIGRLITFFSSQEHITNALQTII